MQKIVLSRSVIDILRRHAKNKEPNESCAMLLGKGNAVSDVFLTENIEGSPVKFRVSSEQTIKGYEVAKRKNVEIVGIFHSHPNSEAYPSSTDKKFMEINPVVWVIYSGTDDDFRAYVLEHEITEIEITEC